MADPERLLGATGARMRSAAEADRRLRGALVELHAAGRAEINTLDEPTEYREAIEAAIAEVRGARAALKRPGTCATSHNSPRATYSPGSNPAPTP